MTGKKVLIVEDMQPIQDALATSLRDAGYTVVTAGNGESGLAVAIEERPDLILVDIIMPKMDGLGMIKALRNDEWGKHAQVMLLTNLDDADKVMEAHSYDVYDYLVKAYWKLENVVQRINERLGVHP